MPLCSVIVLNYQGEKFIKKTLDSLFSLDYPKDSFEIIVVDNASSDGSRNILERTKGIRTVFLENNLGFSKGNNAGIRIAKGEYIALLNNDCVVKKNWLAELVRVMEKDDNTFAVNSKIMLGNTGKIQNAGTRVFSSGYAQDRGAAPKGGVQDYETDRGQYEKQEEVQAFCGAAVLLRKSILDKIGLFDETFFLYYEDVELSERARKTGYRIVYAPKAVAHHEHAASSGEWSPFFIYHTERGRLMHVLIHFPLRVFLVEYVRFVFKSFLRLGYGIKHPSRFKQQVQYFRISLFFLLNGLKIKLGCD